MTDIGLNIHGLVRVMVENPPAWLVCWIEQSLGCFVVAADAVASPDVRLLPMPRRPMLDVVCAVSGSRHRWGCAGYGDRKGVMLLHREKPDVGLFPGECIEVVYSPRRKALRHIHGQLLFAIHAALRRRHGLLFHGSCLADGDRTVVITGRRISCKTLLGLILLHRGWQYLADDQFLLSAGRAYPVESEIGLRDFHVQHLPWLRELLPPKVRRRKSPAIRALRRIAARAGVAIPFKTLAVRWQQKLDRVYPVRIEDVFPEVEKLGPRRPDVYVHLRPSRRPGFRALARTDMVAKLAAVQRMLFEEMAPIEELLTTVCDFRMPSLDDTLSENLEDQALVEFDVPVGENPEELSGAFVHCLAQL